LDRSVLSSLSLVSDVKELDKPLPPWPGVLTKDWELRMGLIYEGLGITFIGLILAISSSRKKNQKFTKNCYGIYHPEILI
jgi:hypothetical protein